MADYDVMIVGGRPAGSTLAARLGAQGVRVLLLDRAVMPSLPAVSCPIIYQSTMKLLDEIGADEAAYARNTPRLYELYMDAPYVQARVPIEGEGRTYAYAIDRARFDAALWDHARSFPSVTAIDQFHVTDLLIEGGVVRGVVGKHDGAEQRHTADLIVGADGRFSLVARKVNARIADQHTDHPTSLYYAYWRGVAPYPAATGPSTVGYAGDQYGIGYLVMDSADDTTVITVEGQSALLDFAPGKAEEGYLEVVMSHPKIAARLHDAEMVTRVSGMRDVGNFYREAGGAGWALVGDAYFQEDPIDGQGIYNALYGAKRLAQAIMKWRRGDLTWEQAVAWYDEAMRVETYYMYQMAIDRVRTTMYTPPPSWLSPEIVGSVSRWLIEDEQTLAHLGKLMTRQGGPNMLMLTAPPVLAGAMVRGAAKQALGEVRKRLTDALPAPLRGLVPNW
jgi:flavin-dependent dehydrogenase